jgi:hypothetical protein
MGGTAIDSIAVSDLGRPRVAGLGGSAARIALAESS